MNRETDSFSVSLQQARGTNTFFEEGPSLARQRRNFKSFALGEIFMKFPRATVKRRAAVAVNFAEASGLPLDGAATSFVELRCQPWGSGWPARSEIAVFFE
ncbi:MAG: hypothetical protein K2K83_06795 [Rikenella sp.]|nr:hypothetical protein [Rikenella sp.]